MNSPWRVPLTILLASFLLGLACLGYHFATSRVFVTKIAVHAERSGLGIHSWHVLNEDDIFTSILKQRLVDRDGAPIERIDIEDRAEPTEFGLAITSNSPFDFGFAAADLRRNIEQLSAMLGELSGIPDHGLHLEIGPILAVDRELPHAAGLFLVAIIAGFLGTLLASAIFAPYWGTAYFSPDIIAVMKLATRYKTVMILSVLSALVVGPKLKPNYYPYVHDFVFRFDEAAGLTKAEQKRQLEMTWIHAVRYSEMESALIHKLGIPVARFQIDYLPQTGFVRAYFYSHEKLPVNIGEIVVDLLNQDVALWRDRGMQKIATYLQASSEISRLFPTNRYRSLDQLGGSYLLALSWEMHAGLGLLLGLVINIVINWLGATLRERGRFTSEPSGREAHEFR